jgi:anthranilate synthase component 1
MYTHGVLSRQARRNSPLMSLHRPSYEDFARLLGQASCLPVYRQLTGDALTPVSAFRRIERAAPSFLFESVIGGEKVGRFSFLGTEPFLTFVARGPEVTIAELRDPENVRTIQVRDPFIELQSVLSRYRACALKGLPRFAGGAVGYAAYDAVRYTENLPNPPPDDRGLPDLYFALYDRMVLFDHIRKTILVVAQAHVGEGAEPRSAYDTACRRVDELVERLAAPVRDLALSDIDTDSDAGGKDGRAVRSNFSRAQYEAIVRHCQEYIKAGDIFQVVPSQRFELETRARPFDIYRVLRVVNPSPFLFYLPFREFALIGSSPEILVRVEDGTVTIRPLAGTRRRGRDEAEDEALAEELLADPKERAEHIMLVDLGRNDVGRVAQYQTVELSDVMKVERYSHVMHITSNVTGRLRPGQTAFDALRAGLPAGTVSGAPKVRAMQIIDEVETKKRGPYAGAVGYIDFTGNMDTCIALRTLVVQGKTAYIQAGGGIVHDSVPSDEFEETVNKARGLLRAVEIAESQLPG